MLLKYLRLRESKMTPTRFSCITSLTSPTPPFVTIGNPDASASARRVGALPTLPRPREKTLLKQIDLKSFRHFTRGLASD